MLEVLQYVLGSFWRFVGALMLLAVAAGCLSQFTLVKIVIHKETKKETKEDKQEVKRII